MIYDKYIKFYKSTAWKKCRENQLKADHYECQRCKHRGKYKNLEGMIKYTPAVLVHHDFRLRENFEHRLDSFVNGQRNLYSLCNECHEIEHEKERGFVKEVKDFNEERW